MSMSSSVKVILLDVVDSKNIHVNIKANDKKSFAESLYKTTKDDLGKIMRNLKEKCPTCLSKNRAEDEIETSTNLISPVVM